MPVVKPFRFIPTIKKQEFNYEFADYSWFKNFFSEKEVEQIRNLWEPKLINKAEVNQTGKAYTRDELRKSQVMWIKPGANDWIYNRLGEACQQVNLNRYKFDITGFQTELQLAN